MKNVIIAAALLLATIAGHATSIDPRTFVRQSTLVTYEGFDEMFNTTVISPSVSVNPVLKVATLTYQQWVPICPPPEPGFMTCMAVGNKIETVMIELPIVVVKKTPCGSTVYVAAEDKRPVEGRMKLLKVIDNSTMTCEIALDPNRMTEVFYTEKTHGYRQELKTYKAKGAGPMLESPWVEFETQPYIVQ